jgi:hypothetical protein
LALLVAAGCQRGPHTVPVSGRVTLDGVPVGAQPDMMFPARITFLPVNNNEDSPLRPASSGFDGDGRYELRSFKPGDGIMPGEYDVVIQSILSGPTVTDPRAPEVWEIPKRYGRPGESGLRVTVPDQRSPMTLDFELENE